MLTHGSCVRWLMWGIKQGVNFTVFFFTIWQHTAAWSWRSSEATDLAAPPANSTVDHKQVLRDLPVAKWQGLVWPNKTISGLGSPGWWQGCCCCCCMSWIGGEESCSVWVISVSLLGMWLAQRILSLEAQHPSLSHHFPLRSTSFRQPHAQVPLCLQAQCA